ncbi:Adenine deaminase [subsurface metagenome]
MSTLPLEELVEKFKKLQTAVMEIKPIVSEPFMALAFVALPVIPHIKLTDKGLFDVDEFRIVDPVT